MGATLDVTCRRATLGQARFMHLSVIVEGGSRVAWLSEREVPVTIAISVSYFQEHNFLDQGAKFSRRRRASKIPITTGLVNLTLMNRGVCQHPANGGKMKDKTEQIIVTHPAGTK